jgi:hypothetical protein
MAAAHCFSTTMIAFFLVRTLTLILRSLTGILVTGGPLGIGSTKARIRSIYPLSAIRLALAHLNRSPKQ